MSTGGSNERIRPIIPCIIIRIIFECHKQIIWSSEFKGKSIELSEGDSKAISIEEPAIEEPAEFGIARGV